MKILKYYKFLEEINLNLKELEKPIGNIKRGDVLVQKLEDPTKTINIAGKGDANITKLVVNGEEKSTEDAIDDITTDGKYDSVKSKNVFTKGNRYQKVLKTDDGESFALNQIVKDKDFGSKGPGSHTRLNESIQCLYLALKISNPNIELNANNVLQFLESYKNNRINNINIYLNDLDKINSESIDLLNSNKDWAATLVQIPNKLYSFRGRLFSNEDYSMFHVSNKMNDKPVFKLINKFNKLKIEEVYNTETGKKERNSLHNVDFSKFCPADVYVIKTQYVGEINYAIDSCVTVQALSTLVDELFDDRKMIPISLKKIRNIGNAFSFKVIINKERGTKPPTFDIDDFIITKDALKGIGSRISTNSKWTRDNDDDIEKGKRSLTIDSTDTSKNNNVSGEVDGAIARHGKVSFTVIKKLIDVKKFDYKNIQNIQTHKELSEYSEEELTAEVKNMWNELMSFQDDNIDVRNVKSLINGREYNINRKNKIISKLQSLQILYAIYQISKINESDANELITSIMSYALSININMFSTPRYIRII